MRYASLDKDGKRPSKRDREGVSELIGTIIVLGITVTLMSGVIVWVNSTIQPPDAAVTADIYSELELIDADENGIYEAGKINLTHVGGNVIEKANVKITIVVDGSSTGYDLGDSEGPALGSTWSIGEVWTLTLSGYSNTQANDDLSTKEISMMVIDEGVDKIIEESYLQVGDDGGNKPRINMLWLERPDGGKMSRLGNGGLERFTVKAIIYDQDGNLPKDGRKLPTKTAFVVVDLSPLGLTGAMGGGATTPMWDLDGDSVYETNGTHVVPFAAAPGTKTLNLTARDLAGKISKKALNVTVYQVPLGGGAKGSPKLLAWVSPNPVARYQDFVVYAAVSDVDNNVRNESVYANFTDASLPGTNPYQLTDPDGDGVFTGEFSLDPPISAGQYHVFVNVTDFDDNTGNTTAVFNVSQEFAPNIFGWGANPNPVVVGEDVRVWCHVADIEGDVETVDCDLSSVNPAWTNLTMNRVTGTNRYQTSLRTVPGSLTPGPCSVAVHASDAHVTDTVYFKLYVNGLYGPNITAALISPNPVELGNNYTSYVFVEDGDGNLDSSKVYMTCESLWGASAIKYMTPGNVSGVFSFKAVISDDGDLLGDHTIQFWAWDTDDQVAILDYNITLTEDEISSGPTEIEIDPDELGVLPDYLKWVNGRQGYDFFNGTQSEIDLENPTRDFRKGFDWIWIRVASRDLSEVSVLNRITFTNVSSGETVITYPSTAVEVSTITRPSNSDAFSLYSAKGPYFEFQCRVDTDDFPSLGRYQVNIALKDSTPTQFGGPYQFIIVDTINITDQSWNMPFAPFLVTYNDSAYTQETNVFESFDKIYVRMAVESTNLAQDLWGDVEISDYTSKWQVKAIPPTTSTLMSAVSAGLFDYQGEENIPCYQFTIDLRQANGDRWVPGTQGYALYIRGFNDDDEPDSGTYKLSKGLRITSPENRKDFVTGSDGVLFGNSQYQKVEYVRYYEYVNFWSWTDVYEVDTPGLTGLDVFEVEVVSYIDFDNDGDNDILVGTANYTLGGGTISMFENMLGDAGRFEYGFGIDIGNNWYPIAIEPGDLDGDGDQDIIVGTEDDGAWFYENTGGYPKSAPFTAGKVQSIAVGNFMNNDSKMDVVVATGTSVKLFESTGSALNLVGTIASGTMNDVAVADFNGDYLDDIAVGGGTSSSGAKVYYNLGNGNFGVGGGSQTYKAGSEGTPPTKGSIISGDYMTTQTQDNTCEELREGVKMSSGSIQNVAVTAEQPEPVKGTIVSGSYAQLGPNDDNVHEVIDEEWIAAPGNWEMEWTYQITNIPATATALSIKIEAEIDQSPLGADTFTVKWSDPMGWPQNQFTVPCTITNTWSMGNLYSYDFPLAALGYSSLFIYIKDTSNVFGFPQDNVNNVTNYRDTLNIDRLYIAATMPPATYSHLEHNWTITTGSGYNNWYYSVRGYTNDTNEDEKFEFQYSLDGGTSWWDFASELVISSNILTSYEGYGFQSGHNPASTAVKIRVVNDGSLSSTELDSLFIDYMAITGTNVGAGVVLGYGYAVEVGDADGDGDMDVYTARDGHWYVYENTGGAGDDSWDDLNHTASGIICLHGNTQVDVFKVADMDGDGGADVVVTAGTVSTYVPFVYIYYTDGGGGWVLPAAAADVNSPNAYQDGNILSIDVGIIRGGGEEDR